MKTDPLTHSEAQRIMDALPLMYRTIVAIERYTGFRISEILSLRVKDVFENGKVRSTIHLRKRLKKRSQIQGEDFDINAKLHKILLEYGKQREVSDDGLLFPSPRNALRPCSVRGVQKQIKQVAQKLGIDKSIGTHSFRKTFASDIYTRSGANLKMVQRALGHTNVSSTDKYLDVDGAELNRILHEI